MKEQAKNNNQMIVLKNMLIEPGTDYRDQLSEMVKGFPKVKRVLNMNDSVSEWRDSQGNEASLLDHDEEAF